MPSTNTLVAGFIVSVVGLVIVMVYIFAKAGQERSAATIPSPPTRANSEHYAPEDTRLSAGVVAVAATLAVAALISFTSRR